MRITEGASSAARSTGAPHCDHEIWRTVLRSFARSSAGRGRADRSSSRAGTGETRDELSRVVRAPPVGEPGRSLQIVCRRQHGLAARAAEIGGNAVCSAHRRRPMNRNSASTALGVRRMLSRLVEPEEGCTRRRRPTSTGFRTPWASNDCEAMGSARFGHAIIVRGILPGNSRRRAGNGRVEESYNSRPAPQGPESCEKLRGQNVSQLRPDDMRRDA